MRLPRYDFDVSILKLDRDIDLTRAGYEDPVAICLPELGYEPKFEDTVPVVVGWGLIDQDANFTTGILQKLDVPVIPLSHCRNWTKFEITDRMLCAG